MMPPGTYYIGDLCYVMHNEWGEFCESLDDGERVVNGKLIASLSTMYGDGSYYDQFGNEYGVDAGLIGCIKVEDIEKDDQNRVEDGHVHVFDSPFQVYSVDGFLHFGNVVINTGDEDEDEEEDYPCCGCGRYQDYCTCFDDDLEDDEYDTLPIDEDRPETQG